MKNIFKSIMFMAASVAIIASCDDDTTPVLELENAASLNAITPSEYVISKDKDRKSVV